MALAKIGEGVEFEPGIYVHWLEGQPIPYVHQILQKQLPFLAIAAFSSFSGLLFWWVWGLPIAVAVWAIAGIAAVKGIKQESRKVDAYDRVLAQFSEEILKQAVHQPNLPAATKACVLRNLTRRFPLWNDQVPL